MTARRCGNVVGLPRMPGFHLIQDLAVILVVAGVAGWICQRAGLSVVVGFLVAGMLIGPHTPPFALVTEVERVETLAQLGLVFLMFSIGLEFSLRRMLRLAPVSGLVAPLETSAMFALGFAAADLLDWSPTERLFTGAIVAISSTTIRSMSGRSAKSCLMVLSPSVLMM